MDGRAATTENLAKYIFMILVTPPQDLHNLPSRINYKCIFDYHHKATLTQAHPPRLIIEFIVSHLKIQNLHKIIFKSATFIEY